MENHTPFHLPTFRYLILYLAVISTFSLFFVGYNQHSICTIQNNNIKKNKEVYSSIEQNIKSQIKIIR